MPKTTFTVEFTKVYNLVHLFNADVFSFLAIFPVFEDGIVNRMSPRITQKYKNTSPKVDFSNIGVVV